MRRIREPLSSTERSTPVGVRDLRRAPTLLLLALAGCAPNSTAGDAARPTALFSAPQAIAAGSQYVLVANTGFHFEGAKPAWGPGFVTLIRRQDHHVAAVIPTTQLNPQSITVHGETAYVVSAGSFHLDSDGLATVTSDGSLDVIDLAAAVPRLVDTIPLVRGSADARVGAFGSMALDPEGRRAFIGSGTRGDLFVVDLQQRTVLRGGDQPLALFPTARGENGLTTVRALQQGLAVLDFNSDRMCVSAEWDTELSHRRCGDVGVQQKLVEGPIDVAQAPDGRLLVLMTIANSLYRVNGAEQPFVVQHGFVTTGLANNRVLLHEKVAYVLNSLSNNLQRVEPTTGETVLPFAVFPVGSAPYDMVVTEEAEGPVGWVTLNKSHGVALVRLTDGELIEILHDGQLLDGGAVSDLDAGPPADQGLDQLGCPEAGLPPVVGIGGVVQATYGPGAGAGQDGLPAVIQGGPSGSAGGSSDVLSLGVGGQIVVDFGGQEIVDGPGPDFIVFENPFLLSPYSSFAEPARVAVGVSDPSTFVEFPCDLSKTQGDPAKQLWAFPGCAGVRPVQAGPLSCVSPTDAALAGGDAFDLADLGLKQARYLRLTDAGISTMGQTSKGFDLDAVVLIHHQPY